MKGVKKQKKQKHLKNQRTKKYVNPKNAVRCLNEIMPGLVYFIERIGTNLQETLTSASVQIGGEIFQKFGSTKEAAKEAVAEAALISFVKLEKHPKYDDLSVEDKTPWCAITSFALYNLFKEWREGRVGTCQPVSADILPPGITKGSNIHKTLLRMHELLRPGVPLIYQTGDIKVEGNSSPLSNSTLELKKVSGDLLGGSNYSYRKNIWRGPIDGKIVKLKYKVTPAKKNMRIKQYVQPRNAAACLSEIHTGCLYQVEQEGTGKENPFLVSVKVYGQKYLGFGATKNMAKQTAAEAALISFVKPGMIKSEVDDTPWAVLSCFAMFKLYSAWCYGNVGSLNVKEELDTNHSLPESLQFPNPVDSQGDGLIAVEENIFKINPTLIPHIEPIIFFLEDQDHWRSNDIRPPVHIVSSFIDNKSLNKEGTAFHTHNLIKKVNDTEETGSNPD